MKSARKTAYAIFDSMETCDILKVSVFAPNQPDLFIQLAKDYIDEGGDIEFSEDYSRIRKLTPMAELLESEKKFLTK